MGESQEFSVLAVVPDLFFAMRLTSVATRAGVRLATAGTLSDLEARLAEQPPQLLLIDLSSRDLDCAAAIRAAKRHGVPRVVAFGPHKDLVSRATALDAGADQWVTNQRIGEVFGEMLRRGSLA
jgi:DNA-binding response OmpR family regulator